MSFEYIIEKNVKKKLSESDESGVVSKVVSNWKEYNNCRQSNLDKANELIRAINMHKDRKDKNKKDWKADVKLGKLFMFQQTFKAFVWKNIYSSVQSMFDVSGEDNEANNNSNKEKAMLVDILERMEVQKILDDIIDNALVYGELVSFTAWKTKKEEIRRPVNFWQTLLSGDMERLAPVTEAALAGKKYYTDEKEIYNNPYIYALNPAYFVFDVSQVTNWDSCPKICKSFKTANEIINNKLYKLSDVDKETIRNLTKTSEISELSNQNQVDIKDHELNNKGIEVLEHWGDFTLPDGTLLTNWHVVVIAGRILARFAKNDLVINPFTYGNLFEDFETKRGISPLYSVVKTAELQENLVNRTYDLQALTENPPLLAPKEFFEQNTIELEPGKIVTYDSALSTSKPEPFTFNTTVYINDITFLSDLMAEISGIYPNMMGADEESKRTATEISVKVQGQTTRLQMILDTINQYLIVPMVKNVAKLCANFKSGEELIFQNKNNQQETIVVDDTVRQGEYKFTYSDRVAISERFNKADTTIQAIQQFAQFLPLNPQEIFTWYMEQKGVENPERFLQQQPQQMPMQQAGLPQQPQQIQQMPQPVNDVEQMPYLEQLPDVQGLQMPVY